MIIHSDCRHFKGTVPCAPHKKEGVHCENCSFYEKVQSRILVIKLGAMGDVIRTTPLATRIRKEYPGCKITWVTQYPDILPKNSIDEILPFNFTSDLYVSGSVWDLVINLDKEKEACALLNKVQAKKKFGFCLKNNEVAPVDENAKHKFLTGLFDDISRGNTKSYMTEIFEICGWSYNNEPYLMENHQELNIDWKLDKNKKTIGLNTGCGDRWTTRLWSIEKWVELVQQVQKKYPQAHIILLGGEAEHERNLQIQKLSGAQYLGFFSLKKFINLVYQCDVVVTQVTMGMHISIALGKKTILMNNIFNKNEFDLFGKGEIVQPNKECQCFYLGKCKFGASCMEELPSNKVMKAIENHF